VELVGRRKNDAGVGDLFGVGPKFSGVRLGLRREVVEEPQRLVQEVLLELEARDPDAVEPGRTGGKVRKLFRYSSLAIIQNKLERFVRTKRFISSLIFTS